MSGMKGKIKVLIVAPTAPLVGGQSVQAQRLLKRFRAETDLEIDLQPINPKFFPRLQKINYVRTFLTSLKYVFDLLRKIPRYDVIHIFSASYFSFVLAPTPAVLIAKLFGKKTILNYRSGECEDHLRRWRKTAIPTIKLFDSVITPSNYLVDVFAKFGIKAVSISNFVDTEKFIFRERKFLRPVFLSNRNFEPLYNVACILRAFALIQKRCAGAKLIVVGDGSEKENFHKLAAELNLKNVEFTGAIAPSEMPQMYDAADIYLNSPNIDNMPGSVIESFAAGLPVISTNVGGIPYIVTNGETGILVEVDDHEKLADEAVKILEDEQTAQKIIAKARAECVKYSWEKVRSKWLELYTELASK